MDALLEQWLDHQNERERKQEQWAEPSQNRWLDAIWSWRAPWWQHMPGRE